ncbi:MAG: hypothetical protein ACREVI_14350 [Steroidobacteraceae bacterium]
MSTQASELESAARHGQQLLNDVVRLFTDLLIAGGATLPMIRQAMSESTQAVVEKQVEGPTYTELGHLLRDCMEVMCAWRRNINWVDGDGFPKQLVCFDGEKSFDALCSFAGCKCSSTQILNALVDFGAVSVGGDGMIKPETPTFLLGRSSAGGLLATDGLLRQLEAYLRVVHRNVCSVSGSSKARFERACTVAVAIELEPIFDQLVRNKGQEFIDSVDEWLERNAKRESPSGRYLELGAGAYFIDLGERPVRSRLRPTC